jgi:hypothetical protein
VTDATVERVVARTWRSVERWLLREGLVEPDRFDEDAGSACAPPTTGRSSGAS